MFDRYPSPQLSEHLFDQQFIVDVDTTDQGSPLSGPVVVNKTDDVQSQKEGVGVGVQCLVRDCLEQLPIGEYFAMQHKRKSTIIRKKQIIDAARKIIIRKGSEHLTLRAMAREVGFTEAAIYRHFKNKQEVLSFLMNNIIDEMLREIINGAAENTNTLDTVDGVIKHHLSKIEQRRGISFQIIAEIISLGDKELNRKVYIRLTEYLNRLRILFEDGARTGSIRNDLDLDDAAILLFGMLQGIGNIWALSNYSFDLTAKYESLWSIYQKAIQAPEQQQPRFSTGKDCAAPGKSSQIKKIQPIGIQ
jgi:AcrR family transcriptional regulator